MTNLVITHASNGLNVEFPRASDLGVSCQLSAIGEAVNLRRTVSATLVNLADPAFRKYNIGLSAKGLKLPAIDDMWEGDAFTLEAPITLRELGTTPSRTAVEGTVQIVDGHVEYQPIFSVLLIDKDQSEHKDKADVSWSLIFEEV